MFAKKIKVKTIKNNKGDLNVFEKLNNLNFNIRRIYYIYNNKITKRGFHLNKKTKHIYICLNGSCKIKVFYKKKMKIFNLKNKNYAIFVKNNVWREIHCLRKNTILIAFCSHKFDRKDYIYKNIYL